MRERRPLVVVDYRVHFNDTSYAQLRTGVAIWWVQSARNAATYGTGLPAPTNPIPASPVGVGERRDGGWAFRQDVGTPGTAPVTTAVADFLTAIPVGKLVHEATLSIRSVGKHPFTISGVKWTGMLHVRSDRG
jgi:hypothetical protein